MKSCCSFTGDHRLGPHLRCGGSRPLQPILFSPGFIRTATPSLGSWQFRLKHGHQPTLSPFRPLLLIYASVCLEARGRDPAPSKKSQIPQKSTAHVTFFLIGRRPTTAHPLCTSLTSIRCIPHILISKARSPPSPLSPQIPRTFPSLPLFSFFPPRLHVPPSFANPMCRMRNT